MDVGALPRTDSRSKGILLERIGERMPAIQCLVESCSIFPYNWSAWLKIAALVERADEVRLANRSLS